MYVSFDETGRIGATTDVEEYAEGMSEFNFPDDFDFIKQSEYRIVDGEFIHDPLPPTEEEIAAEKAMRTNEQIQLAIPMMVQANSALITDAQALTIPLLFKTWTPGDTYKLNEIILYEVDGELYRIGQPELTATETYKPGDIGTTNLYSHIEIGDDNYEVWKPWDGVSGIYQQGQIVHDPYDNDNLYISKIPNNVWGPPHEQPTMWDPYTE